MDEYINKIIILLIGKIQRFGAGDDLKVGDRVTLSSSESKVLKSFEDISYRWDERMRPMLGKEFPVLEIKSSNDIIAIPSADNRNSGKYYFSKSVFTRSGK